MASTQLGGYDSNALTSMDQRRGVTVTTSGAKTFLDVRLGGAAGTIYVVPPNTFTNTYTGNQAGITLITPTAGKKVQVIGVYLTSEDAIFVATVEFLVSGQVIVKHFESATLGSYIPCNITGNTNEVLSLTITGSAGRDWFVQVNYAEVD